MADETIVRTIKIEVEGANKSLKSVEKAQDNVNKSTGKLDGALSNLPGPLKKAQGGVKQLTTAFKALLANPIVLLIAGIVLAITGLFKAFKKTQAGADKFNDVMKALSAIMEVIVEVAAKVFKALGKIFTGNFREGFEEMRGSVKGLGDEMKDAAKQAVRLEKAMRKLFEAESEATLTNAFRRKQIAELVLLSRDFTKTVDERKKAIIDAGVLEEEILKTSIDLQQQRVDIAMQEILNTPTQQRTREMERKWLEENAKLVDIQTASIGRQRELKNRLNELDAKDAAEKKVIADAELKRLQDFNKILEETKQGEYKLKQDLREQDLEDEEDYLDSLNVLEEDFKEEGIEREKELNESIGKLLTNREMMEERSLRVRVANEELLRDVKENIYQDSITALLGFLGEGSKAAKIVAIADATRSAIKGAINAFQSTLALPAPVGPILAPIAAGAALAAGMANVKKIAAVNDPISGGGGGSVPSVSLASPSSNVGVEDFAQTDVSIGQDVNIIQDQTSRNAVKAYVVESEVTASQDMARQREEEVSL